MVMLSARWRLSNIYGKNTNCQRFVTGCFVPWESFQQRTFVFVFSSFFVSFFPKSEKKKLVKRRLFIAPVMQGMTGTNLSHDIKRDYKTIRILNKSNKTLWSGSSDSASRQATSPSRQWFVLRDSMLWSVLFCKYSNVCPVWCSENGKMNFYIWNCVLVWVRR